MSDKRENWTDDETEELQRLWVSGTSQAAIGREMGRPKNSINSKVNRMRKIEGEERWPERESPIKRVPRKTARGAKMRRNTLPPLPSLS